MNAWATLLCVAAALFFGGSGGAFAQALLSQLNETTTVADACAKLCMPIVDPGGNTCAALDLAKNGIETGTASELTPLSLVNPGDRVEAWVAPVAPPANVPKPACALPVKPNTLYSVSVPSSMPVAFCVSSKYYDKRTGKCGDGKFPYKIVPLNGLLDPEAQVPTVACKAPMVATYSDASKKFNCIVPPGFKLSMGE
jgi:hypothetical protein